MAAVDTFAGAGVQRIDSPATHVAIVTPDNSTDLGFVTRGVSLAVAGDLKVTTLGGETVVIPGDALAAGVIHPLRVSRVFATGTTATGIVAYW